MSDCHCWIESFSWRMLKLNRWFAKTSSAKNCCWRPWSITSCRSSAAVSCRSALWSESLKEWNRIFSLWVAEVSLRFTTSAKSTIRRPTTGRPSHRWFHDGRVPALQAWGNFYGWWAAMMARMICRPPNATILWRTNGAKSRQWERSEVGKPNRASSSSAKHSTNCWAFFLQPRNMCIWRLTVCLRRLRWSFVFIVGRAIWSLNWRVVVVPSYEYKTSLLSGCSSGQLHLCSRRFRFVKLSVVGGTIRSTYWQLVSLHL